MYSDFSNVSAILPTSNGGTGINASAAGNGQILIGNGSGFTLAGLTGTANQVNVTNAAGSINHNNNRPLWHNHHGTWQLRLNRNSDRHCGLQCGLQLT
ncbi:MAG: hypothetical protein FPO08_00620 [Geobacter sp.]|nr:MAG: hypothetical protein FPO08_00620 [Geobacter sp.]